MRMILQLFLFFLLLMGLPDWYIYRNYIRRCPSSWLRRLYWLPTIGLLMGMAWIFFAFEPRPQAMNRMSIFLIIFLCINVPKAIFTLFYIVIKWLELLEEKEVSSVPYSLLCVVGVYTVTLKLTAGLILILLI